MIWKTRPRSDFGSLKAIREGAGPVVLLLHGVGLRAEAWGAQIEALSQDHTVIAPDMVGHRESALPSFPAHLSAYVDAVAEAMTEPAVVVGHSMGAMMALDLAARYPQKIRGVAALNAIYRRSEAAKQAVLTRAASLDGVSMADTEPTLIRWFGETPSPARTACKDWLIHVDPAGFKAAYTVFASEDGPSDKALGSLSCPALFMTGSEEPNSTPAMSKAMAAFAPHGTAITIEGAAHMMPMTHPAAVNAALRVLIQRSTL